MNVVAYLCEDIANEVMDALVRDASKHILEVNEYHRQGQVVCFSIIQDCICLINMLKCAIYSGLKPLLSGCVNHFIQQ